MDFIFIISLFLAHYVGDFLMQTRRIAKNKSKDLECLILHGALLAIPMGIVMVVLSKTGTMMAIMALVLYVLLHMVQDQFIWRYFETKAIENEWELWGSIFNKWFFKVLGLDQMLHMIVVFALTFIFLL